MLHIPESIASIDWADPAPALVEPADEILVHNEIFEVDRLRVGAAREAAPAGRCAVLMAIDGSVRCGGASFGAGQLFLLTADADGRTLEPDGGPVTVIRTMLPV